MLVEPEDFLEESVVIKNFKPFLLDCVDILTKDMDAYTIMLSKGGRAFFSLREDRKLLSMVCVLPNIAIEDKAVYADVFKVLKLIAH